jgi:hypothetical protein
MNLDVGFNPRRRGGFFASRQRRLNSAVIKDCVIHLSANVKFLRCNHQDIVHCSSFISFAIARAAPFRNDKRTINDEQ